ncbi:MAG: hypothetical protein CBC09_05285 [Cellvibrionales bacterium TMED49]|nr:hypothetical protein [Porticoccaceae bacterium]OUU38488.1 MAG: hypothetical protein CBC09_05285 [Cellvibrionales bacterium TMED49]|tara:strand:- start:390 stop:671 length:282 start_codon:yes stop_codon:yes gene_type:complete
MDLKDKLHRLYLRRGYPQKDFVELQLYDGFPLNSGKPILEAIRANSAIYFALADVDFSDPRYMQLLTNYCARFFQFHSLIIRSQDGSKIVTLG